MAARSGFDAGVGWVWNDGTKGMRVGGVTKAPDVLYFFRRKRERFGNVDVGGERFDWRIR